MSVGFEIFAEFFHSVHKLLERVFSFMYDVNRPFVMALFKSMGFICGEIYLGNELNRAGVYKLKQVAKDNGIKCYVIDDMYRIENAYYIKVIVPRTTDLNLLKIIFAPINSNVKF